MVILVGGKAELMFVCYYRLRYFYIVRKKFSITGKFFFYFTMAEEYAALNYIV